jgi:chromosome segregation ATPase
MRHFLIIFCWMFGGLSVHAATIGNSRHFEGKDWLKDTHDKRGKLLLTYLKKGDTSCQALWDEKEKGRHVVSIPDYDLPEVKAYCSARMRFVQIDSKRDSMGGQRWGKGNWKRVFDKEPVTPQKLPQQSSAAQSVPESFSPRSSPEESASIPQRARTASLAEPIPESDENDHDSRFSEPNLQPPPAIKRPLARSSKSVKPLQWKGGTREIGAAQKRLEGVYEKTKDHMEKMHDTWKKLEAYQCNRKPPCLARLQKLKRDLEEHIRGLETRYVDSLEGQNNFLAEELERHLAEDRSHLQDRVVEQLHTYLEDLQLQNQDLAEKIKALRTEGDALVDSLEGRVSPQDAEDNYERARAGKSKRGPALQGPLKVREALDSLTARFSELQRESDALQDEIAAERGHTCPGAECDHVRATLGHAQAYEAEMKDLERKIAALQAQVARTPNGVAKSNADKKIGELLAQVKKLEAANTQSMADLQAGLEQAEGAVATAQSGAAAATQRAEALEAQQRDLTAKAATAQQTEARLRAEIAEVKRQVDEGHVTAKQAQSANSELQEALSHAHAIKEEALQQVKSMVLEQGNSHKTIGMLKQQKAEGKFLDVVQRARLKKAKAANDKLQKDLEEVTKKQTAALAELQEQLETSEAIKTEGLKQLKSLTLEKEEARRLTASQASRIKELEAQSQQLEEAARQEREKAQRESERAAVLEQRASDTVARTTSEKADLLALERRAQQAEEGALQHKQKAEALEAKAQKVEAALAKLEGALGINPQGNELASLGAPQTYDQRLGALVLGIETQRREMGEQKTTLDRQEAQLQLLQESSRKEQAQMEELQRVQKQQEETLKKAQKMEEAIKRLPLGQGYVDTRALESRIKELEDLLRKEAEEKKRASDIVDLQKLALGKKRSELDKQAATMRGVEEERAKLEESLKAQERKLQSQLKELETLRDSKRQSGQTQDEFESALREKQKLVDELKASVAKAQGQFSDQQKRITEQRKALGSLETAHAKQKDILATAYLAATKLNNENDELRHILETTGSMGQKALAERDTAKEEFRQSQRQLQEALQRIADLQRQEPQAKGGSKEQEERIAALEAEKRALLAKNIAQRWRQIAQQALVQRRLGTIKTAVGATEPAQDLGSELAAATAPLFKSFYESVKADADAILLAAQSNKKQLEQSVKREKELQERAARAEDLVARQREALERTELKWNEALGKEQNLEREKTKLETALGALGKESTEGQEEIKRMRTQLEKTKSDLSQAIKQKQQEEDLKDKAKEGFDKAVSARDLLKQEFKKVLEEAAGLNNQLTTEAREKERALSELRGIVESLQKEVADYQKDDKEYASQGRRIVEVTAQAQRQAAELKVAQEALKKAEAALQEEKRALEYRTEEYKRLQGRFEDFKKKLT